MKTLAIITIIVSFATLVVNSQNGIVVLEGYKHAVAFCGKDFYAVGYVTEDGEAFFDEKEDITYVVNHGHKEDQGFADLRKLAVTHCKEYK